ncbi:recombinase family protein [Thalassospira profundimaris]|uniref:recombinase family protein n=1 Tax=Thalassospira profundimaris TaxID=502049 RepID=UPI000DEE1349|nr:recombinase family protein [Thalassospira profundimaris]
MRVAIYARHSTDRQATSSHDQITRCEAYCLAKKYQITDIYYDEAFSGAMMENRPGIASLLMAAFDNRFDRIICEDLSRISRDQADIAHFFKKMVFVGIEVETISEGVINELHIGLKGTMNALYLKDLSDKTHRGMVAAVLRGSVPGGRTYGYEIVRGLDEKGELLHGKRKIVPAEAETIRKIFALYQSGEKLRHICQTLDRMGIPAPSGGKWAPTTLVGTRVRKTGLLRNTLYRGIVTFNRMQYRKNPETGKKLSVMRPESEWIHVPIPELQIVEDATFDAVQALLDERSSKANEYRETVKLRDPVETEAIAKSRIRDWRERQIKTSGKVFALFAGRLKCAHHHIRMGAHWADRYSCKHHQCANRAVRYTDLMEAVLAATLRLKPEDIAAYYQSEKMQRKRQRHVRLIEKSQQKLEALRNRAEQALSTFGIGSDTKELKAWFEDNTEQMRLARLDIDREKRALAALSPPANIREIHTRFTKNIEKLRVWSRDPEAVTQLRNTMKTYTITAHWDPDGKRWYRTCEIDYDFPAMVRILGQKK